jgi:hypothetical protein
MSQNRRACMRARIVCEDVNIGRRELLAGLAFTVALSPGMLAAKTRTRISDLADEIGVATEAAKARVGEEVSLRGYFSPAMRANVLFDLNEKPAMPCAMCGAFHDSGASLAVIGDKLPEGLNMLRAIDVTGTIAVDARGKAQIIARDIAVS